MENILELENISKSFPKSNFLLDKLSFSLPYGTILGFVGENGAGKTTTIGCILNTVIKDSGTVRLFGQECRIGIQRSGKKSGWFTTGIIFRGSGLPNSYRRSCGDFTVTGIIHCFKNI